NGLRATATGNRQPRLTHPPGREHCALGAGAIGASAEEVLAPGDRLVEEALLLERLPQHQPQHRPVAGVADRLDARRPLLDERLQLAAVLAAHGLLCVLAPD